MIDSTVSILSFIKLPSMYDSHVQVGLLIPLPVCIDRAFCQPGY